MNDNTVILVIKTVAIENAWYSIQDIYLLKQLKLHKKSSNHLNSLMGNQIFQITEIYSCNNISKNEIIHDYEQCTTIVKAIANRVHWRVLTDSGIWEE